MDQSVRVLVSPANNDCCIFDSVSMQSNGPENMSKEDFDKDDEEEEYEKEILKASGRIEDDDEGVKDDVFDETENRSRENVSPKIANGTTRTTTAPLANIARTLQFARSWLKRSRAVSAERTPRVDSFLEKLEMAGPSHVTRNNNHQSDPKCSLTIVDPSSAFHYHWLILVSMSVLYNWIFIIARTAFADLQNRSVALWLVLDYVSDLVYVLDMVIQFNTGKYLMR